MEANIVYASGICQRLCIYIFLSAGLYLGGVDALASDLTTEVYVRFEPGIVQWEGSESQRDCDSLLISSPTVLSILGQFGTAKITKMYDDQDSIAQVVYNEADIPVLRPTKYLVFKITLDDSSEACAVSTQLSEQSEVVVYAHQNGLARTCEVVPNDPFFVNQWYLRSTGQNGTYPESDIDASNAWEFETGVSTVLLSVHDTGVKLTHADLAGRVVGDASDISHGTRVAGIMAARGNDSIGVAGIDWFSTVLSYYCGPGVIDDDLVYESVIVTGDLGVTASNHSYGKSVTGFPIYNFPYDWLEAHIYAYNMGVLACAAAGIDGTANDLQYPAGFLKVLNISASTANLYKAPYSNYGLSTDLCAPGGSDVPSNWGIFTSSVSDGNDSYAYTFGTSFATPQVTALAGLLKANNPDLWNDDIAHIMILTADDFGDPGHDDYFGWGKINARNALQIIQEPNHIISGVVTDGTIYSVSDQHYHRFRSVPGLIFGEDNFLTKKYEIRKTINYPAQWHYFAGVWGVGPKSLGLSQNVITEGFHYSGITDTTSSSFVVRTFVYEVWSLGGDYKGFFPCEPSEAVMSYSFLGEPELEPFTSFSTHYDVWDTLVAVHLSWYDQNEYEQGTVIERKDATSGVWSVLDTLPPMASGVYDDFSIIGSETYWYRVKPFTVNQTDIAWTPELQIKALPAPPENVSCRVLPGITCCPVRLSNEVEVIWQEPPPSKQLTPIEYYMVCRKDTYFWNPQKWFGPVYDTVINICPNEAGTDWNYHVLSFDSEGDSSMFFYSFCGARPGSSNRCPGQIEKDNVSDMLPYEFSLSQNYPNPFNPSTRIDYSVPADGNVRLDVVDMLGRVVYVLVNEIQPAGEYSVEWRGVNSSGSPAASGVYFYRLQTKTHSAAKRMVLLK